MGDGVERPPATDEPGGTGSGTDGSALRQAEDARRRAEEGRCAAETARHAAEAALEAADARIRELSEAMFEGLVIHDHGKILWANRAVAELHGVTPEAMVGRSILEFTGPAFREQARAVAGTGEPLRVIGQALRHDGTVVPCEIYDRMVHYEGREVRAIGVRNLSELRAAEEALERTKERLRCIIEGAPDAILVHGGGAILYVNPAGLELAGYDRPDELLGRSLLAIIHPDDHALVSERLRQQGDGRTPLPPLLERIVRRDGSLVPVEVEEHPIEYDGQPASVVFARDVTSRLRVEAERDQLLVQERAARAAAERVAQRAALLAEASRHLSASFDAKATLAAVARLVAVRVGCLCLIDLQDDAGRVQRVAAAHRDPGRSELVAVLARVTIDPDAAEGPPRALRSGQLVAYEDIDPAAFAEGPASPAGTADPEQRGVLRAFGVRTLVAAPLIARGRTLGVLTCAAGEEARPHVLEDVSLIEDLARRVALAVDNARLHEETERAVRLRDEFLSVASHELKTPLTSLTLAVQGLERVLRGGRVAELPTDLATRALEIAGRQATRLGQLVGALLDVTRIQAGRLSLTLETANLAAIVSDVTTRMANDLQAAGCSLSVSGPAEVTGRWDRSRLDQVVTNLLSNAIKFGAGGPVDIRVTADATTARFQIRDRGIGVPRDARERIFRRFERAVSMEHYGGLGLGLYIVRRIVEAHGGTIDVDSEPGVGATFVVALPRAGQAAPVGA